MPSVQIGPVPNEPADLVLEAHVHNRVYAVEVWSLADRGANGGMMGVEGLLLALCDRSITIWGIGNHSLNNLQMCDAASMLESNKGTVIGLFHQYAYRGKGRTIHSCGQIEHYGHKVYDQSRTVGGRQCIVTSNGYILALNYVNGLPYLPMRKPTYDDLQRYPNVVMTSPNPWDPKVLDNTFSTEPNCFEILQGPAKPPGQHPFDEFGNLSLIHI